MFTKLLFLVLSLSSYLVLCSEYCEKTDLNDCGNSEICGKSGVNDVDTDWSVEGGVDTVVGEYPWHALISPGQGKPFCAGALINDNWVLTAGHCVVFIEDVKGYVIRLGAHNHKVKESTESQIKIKKIVINKEYDIGMITNDIALIQLKEKLDFNGKHKHLAPICLNNTNTEVTDNCLVIGFGLSDSNKDRPQVLQKSSQPILDTNICAKVYDPMYSWNIENELCVGGTSRGGFTSCVGDGGGPLQCRASDGKWYLAGINSYGPDPCGKPGQPDVYTKVSTYSEWINTTINSKSNADTKYVNKK